MEKGKSCAFSGPNLFSKLIRYVLFVLHAYLIGDGEVGGERNGKSWFLRRVGDSFWVFGMY